MEKGYTKEEILRAHRELSDSPDSEDMGSTWISVLCHLKGDEIYGLESRSKRKETPKTTNCDANGKACLLFCFQYIHNLKNLNRDKQNTFFVFLFFRFQVRIPSHKGGETSNFSSSNRVQSSSFVGPCSSSVGVQLINRIKFIFYFLFMCVQCMLLQFLCSSELV